MQIKKKKREISIQAVLIVNKINTIWFFFFFLKWRFFKAKKGEEDEEFFFTLR